MVKSFDEISGVFCLPVSWWVSCGFSERGEVAEYRQSGLNVAMTTAALLEDNVAARIVIGNTMTYGRNSRFYMYRGPPVYRDWEIRER